MADAFENKFLSDTSSAISELLAKAGFDLTTDHLIEGILSIVDGLCNYIEEGRRLFPQIVVTNDLDDLLKTIPFAKCLLLEETTSSPKVFKSALKKSAPLATGGWSVFVETVAGRIRYGLVSVESSMLSPSIEANLLLSPADSGSLHFVLLRNVGDRVVQMNSAQGKILIDFSLRSTSLANDEALDKLVTHLVQDLAEELRLPVSNYSRRVLDMSLPFSHGNLIGIVRQCDPVLVDGKVAKTSPIQQLATIANGIILQSPIDMAEIVNGADVPGGDATMRAYASLIRNMLNNDGITIFNTQGKVLGYHVFINSKADAGEDTGGGARTRAFEAMISSGLFECCFFKSQDGFMKIWPS